MPGLRLLTRRRAVVPFVDTLQPGDEITRATATEFERWRAGGCNVPPDLDATAAAYFDGIKKAATTTSMYVMGLLAANPDPWIRLALALNPSAYDVILWGDAEENFGLAQDRNPWVRSTTWLREEGRPPPHVLAALSR